MLNYQLLIFNCQFFQSLRFMKASLRAERSIVNCEFSPNHHLLCILVPDHSLRPASHSHGLAHLPVLAGACRSHTLAGLCAQTHARCPCQFLPPASHATLPHPDSPGIGLTDYLFHSCISYFQFPIKSPIISLPSCVHTRYNLCFFSPSSV